MLKLKPSIWCPGFRGSHRLAMGCIGAWPLWSGAGARLMDVSGNGNTGTWTGATTWAPTEIGMSVRADGDQYVTFAKRATDFITDKFTVVWLGTPAQLTAGIRRFFLGQYQHPGDGYDWGLYIGSSPYRVTFFVRTGAAVTVASTSNLAVGTMSMIAGRYDGAKMAIFFDGLKEDENNQTGNVTGNYDFKLGYKWQSNNADVRTVGLWLYDRALSDGELSELYADPWAMFRPAPFSIFMGQGAAPPGNAMPMAMDHYRRMRCA